MRVDAENLSKPEGLKVSAVVREGKPFEEICGAAQRLGADLIALTTRLHRAETRLARQHR